MVAQVGEYTKNHFITLFKWVKPMTCEFYFNKGFYIKVK